MTPLEPDENGHEDDTSPDEAWSRYRKLVISELKRINNGVASLQKDVTAMQIQINGLMLRAGFYGAVGGAVAGYVLKLILDSALKGGV